MITGSYKMLIQTTRVFWL